MKQKSTPLLRQWQQARDGHPGAVVLIRVGDFYEMLGPDADVAVRELGLALTGKGGPGAIPMAGFPARSRDEYAERLVGAGHRVAICEQVEDAAAAEGTVRREVTEVLTPGAVLAEGLLPERRGHYLAALAGAGDGMGLAAADVSTGEVLAVPLGADTLEGELARLAPAEILLPQGWTGTLPAVVERVPVTRRGDAAFDAGIASDEVCFHYGVRSPEGFGLGTGDDAVLGALGALLGYLREVQPAALGHLRPPRVERAGDAVALDEMTVRNLELVEPLRREPGMKPGEGTLLGVLDETVTPMGARLLRAWLVRPLLAPERIEARLEAVGEFVDDAVLRRGVRDALGGVRDLERMAARLSTGRTTPAEVRRLAESLRQLPRLREALAEARSDSLRRVLRSLDPLADVWATIDAALAPAEEGEAAIRAGLSAELDELRGVRDGGTEWMARLQGDERTRTGITALKVGFHRTFGYFIEVPSALAKRVPAHYERRQTLASAERFATPELKEWESRILDAEDRISDVEARLFGELREALTGQVRRVQDAALRVAMLDVLAALAECAVRRRYVRPAVHAGYGLEIRGGRHPVVETMMPWEQFIPNDVRLDTDARVMILTGPNMGGKSTLLRQVGLIQLLAQVGSFVPAEEARVGIADRIFTRVGASDNLVRGQSTFMVEASECATILNGATGRSLVLMDEVGRGTSTWDGVSLAWAITEALAEEIGARTIFATHYHELTQLADVLPGVVNAHVAACEEGDRVVFLHRLLPGGADRSYGIEVARLAGVPPAVIDRARDILRTLEGERATEGRVIEHVAPPSRQEATTSDGASHEEARRGTGDRGRASSDDERRTTAGAAGEIAERIRGVDVARMTPLAALNLLDELQRRLGPAPGD